MAEPRQPPPALLVIAAFSRYAQALDWAQEQLMPLFGPIGLASSAYEFTQTTYYEATMGPGLRKQLLGFQNLVSLDALATIKLETNQLESQLALAKSFREPRPLNLDPGLLTLGKFMLATMKDQAHRIFLRDGVFAEVTLRFEAGAFEPHPWTYADYRLPEVRAYLQQARDYYRRRLKGGAAEE